jgi:hypothetical protein
MQSEFEYMNYSDDDRLAHLESMAADLEARLAEFTPVGASPHYRAREHGAIGHPGPARERGSRVAQYLAFAPAQDPKTPADQSPPECGSDADPRGPGCA